MVAVTDVNYALTPDQHARELRRAVVGRLRRRSIRRRLRDVIENGASGFHAAATLADRLRAFIGRLPGCEWNSANLSPWQFRAKRG